MRAFSKKAKTQRETASGHNVDDGKRHNGHENCEAGHGEILEVGSRLNRGFFIRKTAKRADRGDLHEFCAKLPLRWSWGCWYIPHRALAQIFEMAE